jgi:hypothetical protein
MNSLGSGVLAVALVAALLGCEPAGPGVRGTIHLRAGVDASGFKTLELRAFPDAASDFDPGQLPSSSGLGVQQALSTMTFPHAYEMEQAMGASKEKHWRLVAWLSRASASAEKPAEGDLWCTTRFEVGDCDGFDGYCGTTGGVDCTLE